MLMAKSILSSLRWKTGGFPISGLFMVMLNQFHLVINSCLNPTNSVLQSSSPDFTLPHPIYFLFSLHFSPSLQIPIKLVPVIFIYSQLSVKNFGKRCGQGWIRTTELVRGQIYSLLPLATWLLALLIQIYDPRFWIQI